MGEWIKNNKFEALLLLVVVVVGLGAYVFGSGKGRAYTEAKASFDEHASSVTRLKGKKPYPDPGRAADYEDQVNAEEEIVKQLEEKMGAFRPETFEQIPPARFIENLNTARSEVARALEARQVEYPEDKFYLGFESYTGKPPEEAATAYLNYQLTALKSLFETLAAARPSALLNVHRPKLPVEQKKSMDTADEPVKGRGGRTVRKSQGTPAPYYRLPVEVTFRSSEPVARKILSDLASHQEHYFVVRSIRIQNEERDNAPEKDEVQFEAPPTEEPADGEGFEEFDDVEDAGDPAAPADSEAPVGDFVDPEPEDEPAGGSVILGRLLGNEEIFVLLEIDVLLFKPKAAEGAEGS